METSPSPSATVINETAVRKHHKSGPSRLEYLDHCAAFTNRNTGGSEYSEEGQLLHDIMNAMLEKVAIPGYAKEGQPTTTKEQLSGWVSETYTLTEEQVTWLRFCCRRCDALIAKKPVKILSEIPVEVKNPDGSQLNHGYLDVLFIFANGTGVLLDWKFGWIPVPHASSNLQGLNYTLACFQRFPKVTRIGVKFVQPKLDSVTEAIFERSKMFEYYDRIRKLIDLAKLVQDKPEDAQKYMHPGGYCEYCALAGSCSMLALHRGDVAARYGMLPELPAPFPSMELATPEQWALGRYWIEVIEKGVEDFKKRAKEAAEANGGEIRCTLPTGEEIVYEIQERNVDRILGDTLEIADTLKDFVSTDEVLACASLSLTPLLKVASDSMVEIRKAEGEKLTKKAAKELIESTLTATGLLSVPDTKIRFLKLRKGAKQTEMPVPPAQIVDGASPVQPVQ